MFKQRIKEFVQDYSVELVSAGVGLVVGAILVKHYSKVPPIDVVEARWFNNNDKPYVKILFTDDRVLKAWIPKNLLETLTSN